MIKNGKLFKKSSITTIPGKQPNSQWMRNVTKSLKKSAFDVFSDIMPATAETIVSTKDFASDVRQLYNDTSKKANLKAESLLKLTKEVVGYSIDDLKSGNFYNKERMDAHDEFAQGFEDFDDDFDTGSLDTDFDMGITSDDGNAHMEMSQMSDENNEYTSINVDMNLDEGSTLVQSVRAQTEISAKNTEYSVKTSTANHRVLMAHLSNISNLLTNHLMAINENVSNISTVISETSSHMSIANSYYEDSMNIFNEINDKLTTMSEVMTQPSEIGDANKNEVSEYKGAMDIFDGVAGGFNLQNYLNTVKKQGKNAFDSSILGVAFNMMQLMGSMGPSEMQYSPLSWLTKTGMKALIPKAIKSSLTSLDSQLKETVITSLTRLGGMSDSQNPILGLLGNIFGIRSSKYDVNKENYTKGPVAWNGIAHRTLVDVIPAYLSQIAAAVTGTEQNVFDYKKGVFRTLTDVREDYADDDDRAIMNQYFDAKSAFGEFLDKFDIDFDQKGNFENKFNDYIRRIVQSPGKMNFNDTEQTVEAVGGDEEAAKMIQQFMQYAPRNVVTAMYGRNALEAAESLSNRHKNVEEDPTAYNAQYIDNGLATISPSSNIGLFRRDVDSEDKDKYWYLKRILQTINTVVPVRIITGGEDFNARMLAELGLGPSSTIPQDVIPDNPTPSPEGGDAEDTETVPADNEEETNRTRISLSALSSSPEELRRQIDQANEDAENEDGARPLTPTQRKFVEAMKKAGVKEDSNSYRLITNMFNRQNAANAGTTSIANRIGDGMFNLLFNRDNSDGSGGMNRLVDAAITGLKNQFNKFSSFMDERVIGPLNESLFGEDGLISRISESETVKRFKEQLSSIKNKATNFLLGEPDENGVRHGGLFSSTLNSLKDMGDQAKDFILHDENGVVANMKKTFTDITSSIKKAVGIADNDEQTKVSFVDRVAGGASNFLDHIKKRGTEWMDLIFGPSDRNGNSEINRSIDVFFEDMKGKKGKLGASATIGLISSFFLPGGPIGGALLGLGAGIVSESTQLKDFLFGQSDENGNRLDNGLISKNIQDFFKENKTGMSIGAFAGIASSIGLLPAFFVPGGPIGGALLGGAISLAHKSGVFTELLYGKDGSKDNITGGIVKFFKDHFGGKGDGTGNVKKNFLDAGIGAGVGIVGSFFLPGGPIVGALLGSATSIAVNTEKFKTLMFGEEELDEAGNKTGKRKGGLFGKFTSFLSENVMAPLYVAAKKTQVKLVHFIETNMINPLKASFEPFKVAAKEFTDGIRGFFSDLKETFKQTVTKPIGDAVKKHVLDPMKEAFKNIFSGVGKIIGSVITAPFKAIQGTAESLNKSQVRRGVSDYDMQAKLTEMNNESDMKRDIAMASLPNTEQAKETWMQIFSRLRNKRKEDKDNKEEEPTTTTATTEETTQVATDDAIRETSDNTRESVDHLRSIRETIGEISSRIAEILPSLPRRNQTTETETTEAVTNDTQTTIAEDTNDATEKSDTPRENTIVGRARTIVAARFKRDDAKEKASETTNTTEVRDTDTRVSDNDKGVEKNDKDKKKSKIASDVRKIADSVDGQLNGVGYNVNKILKIMLKKNNMKDEDVQGENNKKYMGRIRNLFMAPIRMLKSAVNGVATAIKDTVSGLVQGVAKIGKGLLQVPVMLVKTAGAAIKAVGPAIKTVIQGAASLLGSGIKAAGHVLSGAATGLAKLISGASEGFGKLVGGAFGSLGSLLHGLGLITKEVAPVIAKTVGAIIKAPFKLIGAAGGLLKNIFGKRNKGGKGSGDSGHVVVDDILHNQSDSILFRYLESIEKGIYGQDNATTQPPIPERTEDTKISEEVPKKEEPKAETTDTTKSPFHVIVDDILHQNGEEDVLSKLKDIVSYLTTKAQPENKTTAIETEIPGETEKTDTSKFANGFSDMGEPKLSRYRHFLNEDKAEFYSKLMAIYDDNAEKDTVPPEVIQPDEYAQEATITDVTNVSFMDAIKSEFSELMSSELKLLGPLFKGIEKKPESTEENVDNASSELSIKDSIKEVIQPDEYAQEATITDVTNVSFMDAIKSEFSELMSSELKLLGPLFGDIFDSITPKIDAIVSKLNEEDSDKETTKSKEETEDTEVVDVTNVSFMDAIKSEFSELMSSELKLLGPLFKGILGKSESSEEGETEDTTITTVETSTETGTGSSIFGVDLTKPASKTTTTKSGDKEKEELNTRVSEGSAESLKAKFEQQDKEEQDSVFKTKLLSLVQKNTDDQQKHTSIWSSIFSKKGLITLALAAVAPLILKHLPTIAKVIGTIASGIQSLLAKFIPNMEDQGGLEGALNGADEQITSVTDAVGLTNREEYSIGDNGQVLTDENGTAIKEEKQDKIPTRISEFYTPTVTKIDHDTGEAYQEYQYDGVSAAKLNATKTYAIKGYKKVKGAVETAKSVGTKVMVATGTYDKAVEASTKVSSAAKGTVGKIVGLIKSCLKTVLDKVIGFVEAKIPGASAKCAPIKKFITQIIEKVAKPSVVTKYMGKFGKFLSKLATAAGTLLTSEVFWAAMGFISGATNAGYTFEVDKKDVDPLMVAISGLFRGFLNTSYGCMLDIVASIMYEITGTNIVANLAVMIYNIIMTLFGNTEAVDKLSNAREEFNTSYQEYQQEEYDAYVKNQEANGEAAMTFDEFKASDISTSKSEYNAQENQSILKKGFDATRNGLSRAKRKITKTIKSAGTKIKETYENSKLKDIVDTVGNAGQFLKQGIVSQLKYAWTGDDNDLIELPKDDEDPITSMKKITLIGSKVILSPVTSTIKMTRHVVDFAKKAFDSVKSVGTFLAQGVTSQLKYAWTGDENDLMALPAGDSDPLVNMKKIALIGSKVLLSPITSTIKTTRHVVDFAKKAFDSVKKIGSTAINSVTGRISAAWNGEDYETPEVDENDPLAKISTIVDMGAGVLLSPIVPTIKTARVIFESLKIAWASIKAMGSTVKDSATARIAAAWKGEAYDPVQENEENPLGMLGTALDIVTGIVVSPITGIVGTVGGIVRGLSPLINTIADIGEAVDSYSNVFDGKTTMKNYWKKPDTGDGLVGGIKTVMFYITRLALFPAFMLSDVMKVIKNKLKEVPGKVLSVMKTLFGADGAYREVEDEENKSKKNEGTKKSGGKGGSAPSETPNSKLNGFTYYSQNDTRIKNQVYNESDGTPGLMGDRGCGPTALSMVASEVTGKNYDPSTMARLAEQGGYSTNAGTTPGYFGNVGSGLGMGVAEGSANPTAIKESLDNGNPVILQGKNGGVNSPYTSQGHYVVGVGMDGDNVLVNDPRGAKYSKSYSMEDIMSGAGGMWSFDGGKGPEDETNSTTTTTVATSETTGTTASSNSTEQAEQALVNAMYSVKDALKYDLHGPRNPDQGSADCSSTVQWAYKKALGIDPGGYTGAQIADSSGYFVDTYSGGAPNEANLRPGDLLFYGKNGSHSASNVGHVEMYVGGDKLMGHGGGKNGNVPGPTEKTMSSYRLKDYIGAKRYIGDGSNATVLNDFSGATSGVSSPGASMSSSSSDGSSSSGFSLSNFISGAISAVQRGIDNFFGVSSNDSTSDGGTSVSGATSGSSSVVAANVSGGDEAQQVWNYFRQQGLTKEGTAGLMGNLEQESGNHAVRLQGDFDPPYQKSQEYTQKADSGAIDFVNDSKGYGLAQWTWNSRKQGLLDAAKANGKSVGDLGLQLAYLNAELNNKYGSVLNVLKTATDIKTASNAVLHDFEDPKDQSASVENARASLAQGHYNQFANSESQMAGGMGEGKGGSKPTKPSVYKSKPNKTKQSGGKGPVSETNATPPKAYTPSIPSLPKVDTSDMKSKSSSDYMVKLFDYLGKIVTYMESTSNGISQLNQKDFTSVNQSYTNQPSYTNVNGGNSPTNNIDTSNYELGKMIATGKFI